MSILKLQVLICSLLQENNKPKSAFDDSMFNQPIYCHNQGTLPIKYEDILKNKR